MVVYLAAGMVASRVSPGGVILSGDVYLAAGIAGGRVCRDMEMI